MRKTWRWLVALAVVALLAGVLAWWGRNAVRRSQVVGTYTAPTLDGRGTVVFRFKEDGGLVEEVYGPGAARPTSTRTGRWRLSHRLLFLETGSAAAEPVGFGQPLSEMFQEPLLGNESSRMRLQSIDEAGMLLDLGGVTYELARRPDGE